MANMQEGATQFGSSRGDVEGGRWVKISGLQSEAGKKLNGKVGQVSKEELNDEGRHQVKIDGICDGKLIKPVNLVDIPDEDLVKTYRIPASGERGVNHKVLLFPKSHSMFHTCNPRGNSPALARCGLPLVVKKTEPKTKLYEQADYDCQWATWLMIDPVSGFAPMEWQSYVGPVIVYRPGGLDFSADDMDVTNEFTSSLLDMFGEGPDFDPSTWLNPRFFQKFIRRMKEERRMNKMGSQLEGLNIESTTEG